MFKWLIFWKKKDELMTYYDFNRFAKSLKRYSKKQLIKLNINAIAEVAAYQDKFGKLKNFRKPYRNI